MHIILRVALILTTTSASIGALVSITHKAASKWRGGDPL